VLEEHLLPEWELGRARDSSGDYVRNSISLSTQSEFGWLEFSSTYVLWKTIMARRFADYQRPLQLVSIYRRWECCLDSINTTRGRPLLFIPDPNKQTSRVLFSSTTKNWVGLGLTSQLSQSSSSYSPKSQPHIDVPSSLLNYLLL